MPKDGALPNADPNCKEFPQLRLSIHDSIHLIHREDWDHVAKTASIYLDYDHLLALEDAMNGSMNFRYALFHCPQYQPVGIAYFQVVDLQDNGSDYAEAVKKLGPVIGGRIVRELKVRCLVNGNVFHCGDHGAHFIQGISVEQRLGSVEMAMKRLRSDPRIKPKVNLLMFKEFWPEQFSQAEVLAEKKYHPLAMDVNMVMELDPTWDDLEAYQASLNAKARTRLKSIVAGSAVLRTKDMTAEEIEGSVDVMQQLFQQVLDRSPFIFGVLDVKVYAQWKKNLEEKMMFRGFYLDDVLVGFSTAFALNGALDVQYVGLDYALNREHNIYQRMLVDLLEYALQYKFNKINFGRTAEQTKSNLGAEPVEMLLHVKHRSGVANRLIGPLIRSVKPSEFEQRSPFKKVQV